MDCKHCDESFSSDKARAKHYRNEHESELSDLDQKYVNTHLGEQVSFIDQYGTALLVAVSAIVVIGAFGYVLFGMSGGGGESSSEITPQGVGTVHYHGTMEIVVDGSQLDLSQSQYQLQADSFHFENGDGTRHHVHAQQVSLEYALETLGFSEVRTGHAEFQGTDYSTSDGDQVQYIVNGQEVNPQTYVLSPEDEIVVRLSE